jgi:hypothetical protein
MISGLDLFQLPVALNAPIILGSFIPEQVSRLWCAGLRHGLATVAWASITKMRERGCACITRLRA